MLWYQSVTPPNQGWRKRPGVEDFMYSITTTCIIVLKVNTTIINIIEKVTPKYMFTWFKSITLWYKMNCSTIYRPILKTWLISCFTEFLRIQVVLKIVNTKVGEFIRDFIGEIDRFPCKNDMICIQKIRYFLYKVYVM